MPETTEQVVNKIMETLERNIRATDGRDDNFNDIPQEYLNILNNPSNELTPAVQGLTDAINARGWLGGPLPKKILEAKDKLKKILMAEVKPIVDNKAQREEAATTIQRVARGHAGRKKAGQEMGRQIAQEEAFEPMRNMFGKLDKEAEIKTNMEAERQTRIKQKFAELKKKETEAQEKSWGKNLKLKPQFMNKFQDPRRVALEATLKAERKKGMAEIKDEDLFKKAEKLVDAEIKLENLENQKKQNAEKIKELRKRFNDATINHHHALDVHETALQNAVRAEQKFKDADLLMKLNNAEDFEQTSQNRVTRTTKGKDEAQTNLETEKRLRKETSDEYSKINEADPIEAAFKQDALKAKARTQNEEIKYRSALLADRENEHSYAVSDMEWQKAGGLRSFQNRFDQAEKEKDNLTKAVSYTEKQLSNSAREVLAAEQELKKAEQEQKRIETTLRHETFRSDPLGESKKRANARWETVKGLSSKAIDEVNKVKEIIGKSSTVQRVTRNASNMMQNIKKRGGWGQGK